MISEKGFFFLKKTQEILKGISYLLSDRKSLGGYVLRGNTVTQLNYFLVLGLGFPINEMGIKAASIKKALKTMSPATVAFTWPGTRHTLKTCFFE